MGATGPWLKDTPIPFVNRGGGLWLPRAPQINPFVCDFCLARQSLTRWGLQNHGVQTPEPFRTSFLSLDSD